MRTGRIVKAVAGFYYVDVPGERVYCCRAKGAFRKKGVSPMVGDIADIRLTETEDVEGNVERIHTRTSVLSRPVVANVDGALVIFALKNPDPNLYLLDKFLVMMERAKLAVAICFNKADIADEAQKDALCNIYRACGYTVFVTSTKTDEGMAEVRAFLKDKLVTVAGPSGAGKSSMINCLLKEQLMETGEVSKKIGRGKQTTRHSRLVRLAANSYMIDTPGFGTMDMSDITPGELAQYFPEMTDAVEGCRFRGCAHMDEPDCAVKALVADGRIDVSRYESYRQMYLTLCDKRRQYLMR